MQAWFAHIIISHTYCTNHKVPINIWTSGSCSVHCKSLLEPQQVVDWLGFIVDLKAGCFRVPADKIARLKSAIHSITTRGNKVAARFLASVVGQIISMSLAVGPVSRLRTRAMYAVLNQRKFWSDWLTLSLDALNELQFWKQSIDIFNGRSIYFTAGATRVVFSDASSTGYGGYTVELGPEYSQGQWSADELVLSSTWRELKAVYNVLQSFAPKLSGHVVKWFLTIKPWLELFRSAVASLIYRKGL